MLYHVTSAGGNWMCIGEQRIIYRYNRSLVTWYSEHVCQMIVSSPSYRVREVQDLAVNVTLQFPYPTYRAVNPRIML